MQRLRHSVAVFFETLVQDVAPYVAGVGCALGAAALVVLLVGLALLEMGFGQ